MYISIYSYYVYIYSSSTILTGLAGYAGAYPAYPVAPPLLITLHYWALLCTRVLLPKCQVPTRGGSRGFMGSVDPYKICKSFSKDF
jgi:hypothetical protein